MSKAKFEVITHLKLFEPTSFVVDGDLISNTRPKTKEKYKYQIQQNDDFHLDHYNHFPMILNSDGSLWEQANLFLLDSLKSVKRVSPKTLESKSVDLVMFKRWLDTEEVDYLSVPKRIMARPTYRFCAYLHELIRNGEIKSSTAKRRMGTVQTFYRWLKTCAGVTFDYPLWREKEVFINFKDHKGFSLSKKQISTDLSFKQTNNNSDYEEYIQDGGKLRPLATTEQYQLVEALRNIGNSEMTLSFMFALTTGARLQTVFTLRHCHFEAEIPDTLKVVKINTGNGTLIDTKYGKNIVLHIPAWLYRRIQLYLGSKRAKTRNQLSRLVYESENYQYAFLTKGGRPYYMANSDPFLTLYRHPPRGISVNAFIRQQLIPELTSKGHIFSIRFHDLRATFGMNLLEDKIKSTNHNSTMGRELLSGDALWSALMIVQKRLGHSSITTTERYLTYRKDFSIALTVQSEFEKHLMQVSDDYEGN